MARSINIMFTRGKFPLKGTEKGAEIRSSARVPVHSAQRRKSWHGK
jgi:hypothetical protein